MTTYNTATLNSTEALAVRLTREDYALGYIDEDEMENRLSSILGLKGADERRRVLVPGEVVDITMFGDPRTRPLTTAWVWPE